MGTYKLSDGSRITQQQLDRRIKKAKAKKMQLFLEKNGYLYCEECKRNDCQPIDNSHDISVKECKESGRTELAYDVDNITLRGRKCHARLDKNDAQWTHSKQN